MFEIFEGLLQFNLEDILSRIIPVLIGLSVSFAMGLIIYFIYSRFFKGVVFNHNFAVSLALMCILTTMITLAISSNIALSLGMVGALSIVRYRAAIKDPMDLLYLFWAVATGITIGANMHYLAVIGALITILTLMVIRRYSPNTKKYILLLHYSGEEIDDSVRRILHANRFEIKSKTMRKEDVEMAVELIVKRDNLSFMDQLKQIPEVRDLTLVQYTTEYHG